MFVFRVVVVRLNRAAPARFAKTVSVLEPFGQDQYTTPSPRATRSTESSSVRSASRSSRAGGSDAKTT